MANNFSISGKNISTQVVETKTFASLNITVMSVEGLWGEVEYKDYFKREWVEDNGTDYYLDPTGLKRKPSKVTIKCLAKGSTAKTKVGELITFLETHSPVTFKDLSVWSTGVVLIPEKVKIDSSIKRGSYELVLFKIELLNPTGLNVSI